MRQWAVVPDTREYDAFGPWIDEVRSLADVPRLYRDHPLDLSAARSVLKVPRDIARRDATPGTDLYDHLLVLEEARLTVLSRRPEEPLGYEVREVALAEVAAVLDTVDLLDGRLHLHTRDGRVLTLRYNGSARERVRQLVDGLRTDGGRPATPDGLDRQALTPDALGPDDVAVVADVREVTRARPGLTARAWHGRRPVRPRPGGAAGALRTLTHALSPATLQAAVAASDGDHLEVFGRREQLVRGRRPVHSASRLVVPLPGLDRVTAAANPRYAGAVDLVLTAGRAQLTLTVPEGSGTERFLRGSGRNT